MHEIVRVIVPTLGQRLDWLQLTLSSIVSQDIDVDLVLIGPDDPALHQLANDFGATLVVERSRGLSAAINQGANIDAPASLRYVTWLGDDDVLAPGSLAATVARLEQRATAPFAYGRVRYIDSEGRSKWLIRPGRWAIRYARWGRNFVTQPGSLVRLSAWHAVGGLDESLKNSMDQDLFLKLAQMGSPIYVPREVAAFRQHSTSISSTKGGQGESKLVASRYRPTHIGARLVCRLSKVSDRVLLSVHSRIPGPSTPLQGGHEYTRLRSRRMSG